jgi:hypothetical protein
LVQDHLDIAPTSARVTGNRRLHPVQSGTRPARREVRPLTKDYPMYIGGGLIVLILIIIVIVLLLR